MMNVEEWFLLEIKDSAKKNNLSETITIATLYAKWLHSWHNFSNDPAFIKDGHDFTIGERI